MQFYRSERFVVRALFGLLALVGGLFGLAGLYFVPIPEGNREALVLALGLVLGWGSTVIGCEFGASPTGRRTARREGAAAEAQGLEK